MANPKESVFLLCGGLQERFPFPPETLPKQLVSLGGETLVGRALRLVGELTHDPVKVIVAPGMQGRFASEVPEPHLIVERILGPQHKLAEIFEHSPDGSTVRVLFGDVFYTRQAMRTIFEVSQERRILFFGRFGPSLITGKRQGEIFAVTFPSESAERFRQAVKEVDDAVASSDGAITPHAWTLSHYLRTGHIVPVRKRRPADISCEIDDLTDDVDNGADWRLLKERLPNSAAEAAEVLNAMAIQSQRRLASRWAYSILGKLRRVPGFRGLLRRWNYSLAFTPSTGKGSTPETALK